MLKDEKDILPEGFISAFIGDRLAWAKNLIVQVVVAFLVPFLVKGGQLGS